MYAAARTTAVAAWMTTVAAELTAAVVTATALSEVREMTLYHDGSRTGEAVETAVADVACVDGGSTYCCGSAACDDGASDGGL